MNNENIIDKEKTSKAGKRKSYMAWSWIVIVLFFALSVLNIGFALAGFLCMGAPLYFALSGQGKIHCSHYCPRGSFLGKFLSKVALNKSLPAFMDKKELKNGLLIFMLVMFGFSLYKAGFDVYRIAGAMLRLMIASTMVGLILGIIYKPRSWCKVCPMGHATGLIKQHKMRKREISLG